MGETEPLADMLNRCLVRPANARDFDSLTRGVCELRQTFIGERERTTVESCVAEPLAHFGQMAHVIAPDEQALGLMTGIIALAFTLGAVVADMPLLQEKGDG